MLDPFGTMQSIIAFYLSLISILGSLFFIHLGTWYKDITTTEQKWIRYKNMSSLEKHIECYLEAFDEKSPLSATGFTLLTLFMIILGVFAESLKPFAQGPLAIYVYLPMYLFFALYFVASISYLVLGYRKVTRLYREIDKKLSG